MALLAYSISLMAADSLAAAYSLAADSLAADSQVEVVATAAVDSQVEALGPVELSLLTEAAEAEVGPEAMRVLTAPAVGPEEPRFELER